MSALIYLTGEIVELDDSNGDLDVIVKADTDRKKYAFSLPSSAIGLVQCGDRMILTRVSDGEYRFKNLRLGVHFLAHTVRSLPNL